MGIILAGSLKNKSVTEHIVKDMFETKEYLRDEEGQDEDCEGMRINTVLDWDEEIPGIVWLYTRNWVQWGNTKDGFSTRLHCMVYVKSLDMNGNPFAHYQLYNLQNCKDFDGLSYRVLSKYASDEYTRWNKELKEALLMKTDEFVDEAMRGINEWMKQ